ncbi:MAG: DMT family transporter [Alphaproteobacteria bacterium]|jgi:drug/metabolite transporter (DMT)-like permease|nr:DMT family transporter [Alphaproteobacteria bacterium]
MNQSTAQALSPHGRLTALQAFKAKFSNKVIGATFMLLWALTFSTAMAFAKTLSPEVDSVIVLFMRYFFGLLFFSPFILQAGIKGFTTSRPLLHLIRVTTLGIAVGCTYFAYRNLPLAQATAIGMTGPLFTTVLAVILLKDSVPLTKWLLILLGYAGVIVTVRPHEMAISIGVWAALSANLFAALSMICVKLLTRTESTFTLMLYANTATTFIAGLVAIMVWKTPAFWDVMALIAVGGFGVLSQFCNVTALRHANPSFLAPFEYTRICFAIPVGFLFFDEIPNIWVILGSLIIIAATYGLTRVEK